MSGERPRRRRRVRFTAEFDDELAELVPKAVQRAQFLEFAVVRHAERADEPGWMLSERVGVLITEGGLHDIPELLLWFRIENDRSVGEVVVFESVRLAVELYEEEDDT